jgi:hypothetical protein
MKTNGHQFFAPKAFGALECGGPPENGFAVANSTPLSGTRRLLVGFGVMEPTLAHRKFGAFGG